MNPGPSRAAIESEAEAGKGQGQGNGEEDFSRFGLMATLVKQWATRLPMALALGAGEHIKLPPGNMELIKILDPFESK